MISSKLLNNLNNKEFNIRIAKLIHTTSNRGAELKEVDLSEANLQGINLQGVNMKKANLSKANLQEANLQYANLSGANLSGANLEGALLIGANLANANLTGANLSGTYSAATNFSYANLSNSNFFQANLAAANLTGANLDNTNLIGARLLSCNTDHDINITDVDFSKLANPLDIEQLKVINPIRNKELLSCRTIVMLIRLGANSGESEMKALNSDLQILIASMLINRTHIGALNEANKSLSTISKIVNCHSFWHDKSRLKISGNEQIKDVIENANLSVITKHQRIHGIAFERLTTLDSNRHPQTTIFYMNLLVGSPEAFLNDNPEINDLENNGCTIQ